jgi:hypothetical protein
MNHVQLLHRLSWVAVALWVVACLTLVAATTEAVDPILRAADVAREKDVVWLSLVTAIVSLLFSAWLVRQMVNQANATLTSINNLTQELRSRPCFYREEEREREHHHQPRNP